MKYFGEHINVTIDEPISVTIDEPIKEPINEPIDEFFSAPFPQSEYNALQFPIPYIKKPLYDKNLQTVTPKPEKMLPAFKYSTQVELPPKDDKTPKYLPHNKIIKATFFEDMKEYDEVMEDLVSGNNQVK